MEALLALKEGRDTRKAAAAGFGCRAGRLHPDAGGVGAMGSGQAARIHGAGGGGFPQHLRWVLGGQRAVNGGSSAGRNEGLAWAFWLLGKVVLRRLTLQCRGRDRVPLQRTALFAFFISCI